MLIWAFLLVTVAGISLEIIELRSGNTTMEKELRVERSLLLPILNIIHMVLILLSSLPPPPGWIPPRGAKRSRRVFHGRGMDGGEVDPSMEDEQQPGYAPKPLSHIIKELPTIWEANKRMRR